MGEKTRESDPSDSSDEDDDNDKIVQPTQEGAQGVEGADVVVGGEKISIDKSLSDKEKKKLAQREAKRKRDELVSKMTKATEDGLGSIADMIEMFTKQVGWS